MIASTETRGRRAAEPATVSTRSGFLLPYPGMVGAGRHGALVIVSDPGHCAPPAATALAAGADVHSEIWLPRFERPTIA